MGSGCQYVGLVLHEFGHAIGYFHEHNRPDRDDVVDIQWDNIQYGFKDAFYKYTFDEADVQGFKYDLTSIMHYENSAFTNGYCRPTMLVKKDPSYEVTPVYLREFSPQDIQKINKLYSCPTTQLPPTVLPGNGNPDPSQCVCEDKYDKCPEWKTSGECHKNMMWMTTNCAKSCRTCGEPDSDCQDVYPVACENWGQVGECDKNPIWMNEHCKRTCKQCTGTTEAPTQPPQPPQPTTKPDCAGTTQAPTQPPQPPQPTTKPTGDCKDVYPADDQCPAWKKSNWCEEQKDYMKEVCQKTCGFCGGGGGGSGNCKDVYPQHCPGYKQNGMCTNPNYLDYVKEVCKYTCGFC
ncbi:metalloendopeptidase [Desmophyllum pertusum]|uniref:Metalloendopeptidase n=1 Tax=Desmophyllum pertusum TaxID=174260 RepID=A0A9X0CWS9_9CNID|nr:metalloendopeptidase [Desmophyllum pertusum]